MSIPQPSSPERAAGMPLKLIGAAASLVAIVFAIVAPVAKYHIAPLFLVPLIWIPYFLRHRLSLHPAHYLMFCLAVLLHDLGTFGSYQKSPLPFSFDILVHYYFGLVGSLLIFRALAHHFPLRPWQLGLTTLLFVMGTGALHEIMEYASYLLLGTRGMLDPQNMYFFDTQRDLLDNLLGSLTALLFIFIHRSTRAAPDAGDVRVARY